MGSSDPLTASISQQHLILFDGVCNLCNGAVQFIINRDPKSIFKFASIQSEAGQEYLKRFSISGPDLYSVILIKKGKVYDRSAAVFEIARDLSGLWPAFYPLKFIPAFVRDGVYKWIARNRYRWFGKQDQCMIPTPELKARFLQ